jgi:drug/metabolite transporter (DMT)-like permease
MASVTGAVSAALGGLFFHERLARHQVLGIALVVAAVAVLGAE